MSGRKKKTREPQKENVGPTVREEEQVFRLCTFLHLSMTLTFMLQICLGEKHLYVSQVERRSKLTGTNHHRTCDYCFAYCVQSHWRKQDKTPGPGAQSALRALARACYYNLLSLFFF